MARVETSRRQRAVRRPVRWARASRTRRCARCRTATGRRSRAEVEDLYPSEYARWESDPFSFDPEGGETGLAVTARALPALLEIVASHPEGRVLAVSHKATIRLLIGTLLGFDARSYRDRLDQSPACLNILDFRDLTRARLTLFNDTSHYGPTASATPGVPAGRLSKWWGPG